MGSITLKDLSTHIDISQVAAEARRGWEKKERGRLSIERKLLNLLPLGLVIVTLVFYSLSAPHTAHILDLVTPGWGWVAPVGFEFALLVISALVEAGWNARLIRWTGHLLLLMTIIINISASFIVVVMTSDKLLSQPAAAVAADSLNNQTFQSLIEKFPTLPAATQVALLMVIPIGFAIAVVAKLAGAAIVKLALGKVELNQETLDDLWAKVEQREVKSALMQAALSLGCGIKTAGKWAQLIIDQMYDNDEDVEEEARAAVRLQAMGNQVGSWENGNNRIFAFHEMGAESQNRAWEGNHSQSPIPNGKYLSPKMQAAVAYLQANAEARMMSGRDLEANAVLPDGTRVSYRTWNDAKKLIGR